MSTFSQEFKVLVLGDEGSGKSTSLLSLVNGKFVDEPTSSGMYYITKKFVEVGGNRYLLSLLDCDTWKSLSPSVWKKLDGVAILYKTESKKSFHHVRSIIRSVIRLTRAVDVPMVIVGNSFFAPRREVSEEMLRGLADTLYGTVPIFDIDLRSHPEGIIVPFERLTEVIVERRMAHIRHMNTLKEMSEDSSMLQSQTEIALGETKERLGNRSDIHILQNRVHLTLSSRSNILSRWSVPTTKAQDLESVWSISPSLVANMPEFYNSSPQIIYSTPKVVDTENGPRVTPVDDDILYDDTISFQNVAISEHPVMQGHTLSAGADGPWTTTGPGGANISSVSLASTSGNLSPNSSSAVSSGGTLKRTESEMEDLSMTDYRWIKAISLEKLIECT